MRRLSLAAASLFLALGLHAASAATINGTISFAGSAVLDSPIETATAFTAFNDVTVGSGSGNYAATVGAPVNMSAFQFDPVLDPDPTELWSFSFGGDYYNFVLSGPVYFSRYTFGPVDYLTLYGYGVAHIDGYQDTSGAWMLTTQGTGSNAELTFSTTTTSVGGGKSGDPGGGGGATTPVPEGGTTVALLGGVLMSLYIGRRRVAIALS